MAYSEKVIDHYQNPKNVGTLDKNSKNVGTGLVGAPECGDVMRLQIEVDDATGMITDAKFKTFGCGSAIASSSLATEWLKGKSIDEALTVDNMDFVEELNLPPVKIHCSVLAEDAIKSAINDYRVKNGKNVGTGLVGAPECGDVMRLQIEVDDATGMITDAKFKTFGCGSAIASSSLATEWLKGKSIDEALTVDNMDFVEELNLPPVKIHCSVLAEDAIKSAINDYRVKNGMDSIKFEESVVH